MTPSEETIRDLRKEIKAAKALIDLAVITLSELDQDEVLPMRAKPLLNDMRAWRRSIQ